jgi:hypothetical protein
MTCMRPTSGRRCSRDLPEANLRQEHRNTSWAAYGPPDGLPSEVCPQAATKLDKLDIGRRRPDDRVICRRSADTLGREVEHTRRARYLEITQMKGN